MQINNRPVLDIRVSGLNVKKQEEKLMQPSIAVETELNSGAENQQMSMYPASEENFDSEKPVINSR